MTRQNINIQDRSTSIQGFGGQTTSAANTSGRIQADTGGLQIISAILEAAPAVTQAGLSIQQGKIEDDKIKQRNRALRGLEPTDDATDKGYIAHSLIGLQNESLEESAKLKALASSFDGTDEEWDDIVVSGRQRIQDKMFSDYPQLSSSEAQTEFLGAITNSFSESTGQIQAARIAGRMGQEQQARKATFTDNLVLRSEGLEGEELFATISALMSTGGDQMQLSETEVEAVLIDAATLKSKLGDNSLVDFAKKWSGGRETTLFQRTPELQLAEDRGQSTAYRKEAVANEDFLRNMGDDFYGGLVDKSTTQNIISQRNKDSGDAFMSEVQIKAFFNKGAVLAGKVGHDKFLGSLIESRGEGDLPAGVVLDDPQDRTRLAELVHGTSTEDANNEIAHRGITDPDEISAVNLKHQSISMNRLAGHALEHKPMTKIFAAVWDVPIEKALASGEMPKGVIDKIKLWNATPLEGQRLHGNTEVIANYSNFNMFKRQGATDLEAFDQAQRASRHIPILGDKLMHGIPEALEDAFEDVFDGISWWPSDGTSDPERLRILAELTPEAVAMYKAGNRDIDDIAKRLATTLESNGHRTSSEQIIRVSTADLSKGMDVHPTDINSILDYYKNDNKEFFENISGGLELDEIRYEVNKDRGTFVMRSIHGALLTPPRPLTDIKRGSGDAAIIKSRTANRKEQLLEVNQAAAKFVRNNKELKATDPEEYKSQLTDITRTRQEDIKRIRAEFPLGEDGQVLLGKRSPQPYSQRENQTEEDLSFDTAVRGIESDVSSGFNKDSGTWTASENTSGGSTIGYGHKLSKLELKNGAVIINGKRYNIKDGESQVDETAAKQLYKDDMQVVISSLESSWKGYSELDHQSQYILQSLGFNSGKITKKGWPDLNKALESNDVQGIYDEMLNVGKGGDANGLSRDAVFRSVYGEGAFIEVSATRVIPSSVSKIFSKAEAKGYDTIVGNKEIKKDSIWSGKKITSMTIGDILDNAEGTSDAVGKYQMTPTTLRQIASTLKLPDDTVFTPKVQDEMLLSGLLGKTKRPKLAAYLRGDTKVSYIDARTDLAKEWAGFPVPKDMQGMHKLVKKGESYYEGGSAGNKSNVTEKEMDTLLSKLKELLSSSSE